MHMAYVWVRSGMKVVFEGIDAANFIKILSEKRWIVGDLIVISFEPSYLKF